MNLLRRRTSQELPRFAQDVGMSSSAISGPFGLSLPGHNGQATFRRLKKPMSCSLRKLAMNAIEEYILPFMLFLLLPLVALFHVVKALAFIQPFKKLANYRNLSSISINHILMLIKAILVLNCRHSSGMAETFPSIPRR